ncbi:MAG TPA: MMPL family transporter [Candidatus Dormibacteraeota bacterium]|nr:MMPL family transporter [Candidatus Dormibacteraeota bacterium]
MAGPDHGGRARRLLRRPVLVVAGWLATAALALLAAPSLTTVAVQDETALLPRDAPSQQTAQLLHRLFPHDPSLDSGLIVLHRDGGLTAADHAYQARLSEELASPAMARTVASVESASGLSRLSSVLTSPDGTTALIVVGLRPAPFSLAADDAVTRLRARLDATAPPGLLHHLSGVAGLSADETGEVTAGFTRTAIASVTLVLLILLLVYRSLRGALVPLITSGIAFAVALGVIGTLATHGLEVSSLATTLMVVMVFGAGTDYCLFIVARYREELGAGVERTAAVRRARRATAPVIAASGATVIFGFLSLLTARMGIYRTIGPAVGVAVAVTVAAGLTLTPALLELLGGRALRPRQRTGPGVWERVGARVRRRPVAVSVAVVAALLVCATGLRGFHQSFDLARELPPSADSRQGAETIAGHLPTGELAPIVLVVDGTRAVRDAAALDVTDRLTDALRALPGVAEVRSATQPAGAPITLRSGPGGLPGVADMRSLGIDPNRVDVTPLLSAMGSPAGLRLTAPVLHAYPQLAAPADYFVGAGGTSTRLLVVVHGDPYAPAALQLIPRVASTAAATLSGGPLAGARLSVGGPPALFADIERLGSEDFHRIVAVLLVSILVVLALLLRSPVTPLYLLATVLLSYAAALGLTVVVFSGLLGQGDLSFWVPPFLFVILVALGADYNIFITSRMREALDQGAPVADAAVRGLVDTGPVISSAGLILAGTFVAMVIAPLPTLAQMGFAVTVGVLIDTFLVRPLLVPALTIALGPLAFWPISSRTRPRRALRLGATAAELGLAAAVAAVVLAGTPLAEGLTAGRVPGAAPAATAPQAALPAPRIAPAPAASAHATAPVAAPRTGARATPAVPGPPAPAAAAAPPAGSAARIAVPASGGWLYHLEGTRRVGVVGSQQPFSEEVTTGVSRTGGTADAPVLRLSTSSNAGSQEDERRYAPGGVELLATQGSTTGLAFGGTFQPPLLLLGSPVRVGATYVSDWSTGSTHGHTTTTVTGTRTVSVAGRPHGCTVTRSDTTFSGDLSGSRKVTSCWVTELGMAATESEHDQGTYQGVPFDVTTDRTLEAVP